MLTYDAVKRYYPQLNRKLIGAKDVGREVLRNKLLAMDASRFEMSVPVTTCAPRPTATGQLEQDGRDFHVVTRVQFQADVAAHRLAEFGEFDGNFMAQASSRCGALCRRAASRCYWRTSKPSACFTNRTWSPTSCSLRRPHSTNSAPFASNSALLALRCVKYCS